MITFIVTKDDNTKTIQFSNEGTLLDLKKEIIKLFELDCEYIDYFQALICRKNYLNLLILLGQHSPE